MTRSRDWIDYLPNEADRDRARRDPHFSARIEATSVGQLAHFEAAWAPLWDAWDAVVRRILAALGGPFRSW